MPSTIVESCGKLAGMAAFQDDFDDGGGMLASRLSHFVRAYVDDNGVVVKSDFE